MKTLTYALMMMTTAFALPAFATVVVSSPANGTTVGSSVSFVANATTSTCSKGVASMGIYVDGGLDYTVSGASLNKTLTLASGSHQAVVEEWDYCGAATTTVVNLTVSTAAGVTVSSPANGATVPALAPYIASATTSCSKGVASMGVYVDGKLGPVVQGSSMNTQVSLSNGTHNTVVQSWDNCGGSATKAVTVSVAATGTTLSNLQATGGWNQWGELPPVYNICSPCSGVTWSMTQHESAVSLTGNGTKFTIGGSTPYADVLWSNPVLGQGSTEGLPDTNHTLLPTIHNMTLDTEVYVTNFSITQDLEFDVNLYMNGVGMEWGTQCNHLADGDWDIWNNASAHWFSTGVACTLNNGAWNHVVVQAQRESNNDLLYQSITVNGVVHTLNTTVAPFAVPSGWWGMTVNYQMDGNHSQTANTTYLDKTSVTYW
jgi:hypothetical protein